jgi:hypothetical protein
MIVALTTVRDEHFGFLLRALAQFQPRHHFHASMPRTLEPIARVTKLAGRSIPFSRAPCYWAVGGLIKSLPRSLAPIRSCKCPLHRGLVLRCSPCHAKCRELSDDRRGEIWSAGDCSRFHKARLLRSGRISGPRSGSPDSAPRTRVHRACNNFRDANATQAEA